MKKIIKKLKQKAFECRLCPYCKKDVGVLMKHFSLEGIYSKECPHCKKRIKLGVSHSIPHYVITVLALILLVYLTCNKANIPTSLLITLVILTFVALELSVVFQKIIPASKKDRNNVDKNQF